MIWLMICILFAGALFMVCCALYGMMKLKNNPLEKYTRNILFLSAITVSSYAVAMISRDEFPARLFFGICTFVECFTVISVFNFVKQYLGYEKSSCEKSRIINSMAVIDMVLMLINSFADFVFKVEPYYFGGSSWVYRISEFELIYLYHLVFLITVGIAILLKLLVKIISSPST